MRAELPKWMAERTEPHDAGSSAYTQEAIAEHCVSRSPPPGADPGFLSFSAKRPVAFCFARRGGPTLLAASARSEGERTPATGFAGAGRLAGAASDHAAEATFRKRAASAAGAAEQTGRHSA